MDRKEHQGREDRPDQDEHQDVVPSCSGRNQEEPQASQDQVGQQDQVPLFPFFINGPSVPHIGEKVFQYLDKEALINCRAVSTAFQTYVDIKTPLWKNKSLMEAVIDKDLDDTLRLQIIRKILERKQIEWNIIKQKILKATEEDKPDIVLQLSKKFVDESDKYGCTPLHEAARRGQSEVCSAILNSHVHEQNPADDKGRTPLHEAAKNGLIDTVQIIMDIVEEEKNPLDKDGYTPLDEAVFQEHVEVCTVIMDRVDEKNPSDESGNTPLHLAAQIGNVEVCTVIMDRVEVEEKNPPNEDGKTPLHVAALRGYVEVCSAIMDQVNEKNPPDEIGRTPLHYAAGAGHIQVYTVIMDRVDEKNPPDEDGWTPLHAAAFFGKTEMCQVILDIVKDKAPLTSSGETPLQYAIERHGEDSGVSVLIKRYIQQ